MHEAGTVEEDINRSDLLGEGRHGGGIADIEAMDTGDPLRLQGRQSSLVDVGGDHLGALGGKRQRAGLADAGSRRRAHCDLACRGA